MQPLNSSEIEIQSASGMLRVTVKPRFGFLLFVFDVGLVIVLLFGWHQGRTLLLEHPFVGSLFLAGILAAAIQQLLGEEIEFDGQQKFLFIHRRICGWPYTRTYALDNLSELEPRTSQRKKPDGLCCKTGGMTFTFGKGVNHKQADRIIAELQRALPDVAHQMLARSDPFSKHFTGLNLS
ncbi:MAG: hypothetical protein LAP21_10440 [Acidobacteriia bacterium]|nr:hypothetical protein [Terriglobia bacterium]